MATLMYDTRSRADESGYVLVVVATLLIPLVVLVGAASMAMIGHNSDLLTDIDRVKALMAAEAGLDQSLVLARQGELIVDRVIERDLGSGVRFVIETGDAATDGRDNDGDGAIDEADEIGFQVVVTGSYRAASRRLAGFLTASGASLLAGQAMYCARPMNVKMEDSVVSGLDPGGDPTKHVWGMSIAPPNTVAGAFEKYERKGTADIHGVGGSHSVRVSPETLDVTALAQWVRDNADTVVEKLNHEGEDNGKFGDAAAGDFRVVHVTESMDVKGTAMGAGILLVEGKASMEDASHWDGLILCMRDFKGKDDMEIRGAVIFGSDAKKLNLKGPKGITFSGEMLRRAGIGTQGSIELSGWREVSAK